jgi:hypothetical protein
MFWLLSPFNVNALTGIARFHFVGTELFPEKAFKPLAPSLWIPIDGGSRHGFTHAIGSRD